MITMLHRPNFVILTLNISKLPTTHFFRGPQMERKHQHIFNSHYPKTISEEYLGFRV